MWNWFAEIETVIHLQWSGWIRWWIWQWEWQSLFVCNNVKLNFHHKMSGTHLWGFQGITDAIETSLSLWRMEQQFCSTWEMDKGENSKHDLLEWLCFAAFNFVPLLLNSHHQSSINLLYIYCVITLSFDSSHSCHFMLSTLCGSTEF